MNVPKELKEEFKMPIISVSEYKRRIQSVEAKIKQYYQETNENNTNFKFFYRGDMGFSCLKPKIFNELHLAREAKCFKCKRLNYINGTIDENDNLADFKILARMQHAGEITRLLDFTTDPLVALRFACGRKGENFDKKVTVFYTNVIVENELDKTIPALMKLVKSDNLGNCTIEENGVLLKDYFIDAKEWFKDNERLNRQKGMFLFMGNFENIHYPIFSYKKVVHHLSEKYGRGKEYPGIIDALTISGKHINNIRKELETYEKDGNKIYSIDYLMNSQKEKTK